MVTTATTITKYTTKYNNTTTSTTLHLQSYTTTDYSRILDTYIHDIDTMIHVHALVIYKQKYKPVTATASSEAMKTPVFMIYTVNSYCR